MRRCFIAFFPRYDIIFFTDGVTIKNRQGSGMDINDLKLFARAAELGNITHAAAELDYTQSAACMW